VLASTEAWNPGLSLSKALRFPWCSIDWGQSCERNMSRLVSCDEMRRDEKGKGGRRT
jgi:hypothetical protein